MSKLTAHTDVTAEKIRILFDAGVPRGEIGRFLEIRYQHVQNVLKRSGKLDARGGEDGIGAPKTHMLQVKRGGSVTLPAEWLSAEDLGDGSTVVCREEAGGLRIMTRTAALEALRQAVKRAAPQDACLFEALVQAS